MGEEPVTILSRKIVEQLITLLRREEADYY
jgi:hypothetical protein